MLEWFWSYLLQRLTLEKPPCKSGSVFQMQTLTGGPPNTSDGLGLSTQTWQLGHFLPRPSGPSHPSFPSRARFALPCKLLSKRRAHRTKGLSGAWSLFPKPKSKPPLGAHRDLWGRCLLSQGPFYTVTVIPNSPGTNPCSNRQPRAF